MRVCMTWPVKEAFGRPLNHCGQTLSVDPLLIWAIQKLLSLISQGLVAFRSTGWRGSAGGLVQQMLRFGRLQAGSLVWVLENFTQWKGDSFAKNFLWRLCAGGTNFKAGGPGACFPGKFLNLDSLKGNFLHSLDWNWKYLIWHRNFWFVVVHF